MIIRVEFYSLLRDITGREELDVEVEDGSTVAGLMAEIFTKYPELADWDSKILIAAGLDYVERTHVLQPDDIVSVMPPVQGG